MHASLNTHHHFVVLVSAHLTVMALSVLPDFRAHLHQLYWCTLPDLDFLSFVHKVMLPRTLIATDSMLYASSSSHMHAPGTPQGPTYLPVGSTLSILVNTNNIRDAHDAWGFFLLHILHCPLTISDLLLGVGCGIFWAMPHWIRDVLSSLVAALTWQCCIWSSVVP